MKKELKYKRKSCYDLWDNKQITKSTKFAQEYTKFLDTARTERQCVNQGIKILEKNGFKNFETIKSKINIGDKIYFNFRNKSLIACTIGKKELSKGIRLIVSHIDSPRIDLKYNPIYESDGLCLFKTYYYGGIKKYQWVTIPLSLNGVIFDKNGKKIEISIGDKSNEPVFFLSDLLPHLGKDQLKKEGMKIIEGEQMNLIIGSQFATSKKEKLKDNILNLLNKKYNIDEKSLLSAELQITPSLATKSIGFDESMIGGYGHDDRSCSYSALRALVDYNKIPNFTNIMYWVDKEEIGSAGTSSADSKVLTYFLQLISEKMGKTLSGLDIDKCMFNSKAISADVASMLDPNFKSVFDPANTAIINHGIVIEKHTGGSGKSSANDADSEYLYELLSNFEKNDIVYQMGNIGKVDQGGGGTVSKYFAKLGIQIIDMGIGVLNMHSPYEVIAKADLFASYEAYKTFWTI